MRRSKTIVLGITLASALAFTGGCLDDEANRGQVEQTDDSQNQDYRAGASAGWGDSSGPSSATSGSTGYHGGTSHYWFHPNTGYTGGTSSGIRPFTPSPPHYTAPITRGIFGGTAHSFSSGGMS